MAAGFFEHWHQVNFFEWMPCFHLLTLPSTIKLVGYGIATSCTYSTGHDAHPGTDRLLTRTGLTSDKTVRNGLAELRRIGLIERRFHGSYAGRKALADMYYLTLHDELRVAAGMKPCECPSGQRRRPRREDVPDAWD
jgi:hypothetical protein